MTTFTAREVRELANFLNTEQAVGAAQLHAFADRLEADEKAMPVAYAEFTDGGCIRMWSRQYEERLPGTRMIPLYTHSQPAQDAKYAARYRWLRDMRNREQAAMLVSFKMNLDAAIDAAMAEESGNG